MIYVVSDCAGFIGAFSSMEKVKTEVFHKYPITPYIVQKYPSEPSPKVWVVIYRDIEAVAFVSTDREEAEKIKEVYARVGLVYEGSIDYWEQPLDKVSESAIDRLESQLLVHRICTGEIPPDKVEEYEKANATRTEKLFYQPEDSPLIRLIRENERITIMDCVVPTLFPMPEHQEPLLETQESLLDPPAPESYETQEPLPSPVELQVDEEILPALQEPSQELFQEAAPEC